MHSQNGHENGPPPETRDEIMEATYRALCAHGYAGLTMGSIAEEFDKSQSLLHYHYDTKEELLGAFLEYLIDDFLEGIESADVESPRETLFEVLDRLLSGPHDRKNFHTAMLELRAQAPYDEAYRSGFAENDDHLRTFLTSVIEGGIERGEFEETDADRLAADLLIVIDGLRMRRVLGDEAEVANARDFVARHLRRELGVEVAPW